MHSLIAVLAVSALGIDYGYQPLEGGGVEYIIQLKPHEIEQMINVSDLQSDVPKDLDVRRIRITVGNETLSKTLPTELKIEQAPPAEETAQPTIAKKEIVAEGSIPPTPTTVQKPVTAAAYSESDPEPRDEEGYSADPRRTEKPRSSDPLFNTKGTSSKALRSFDEEDRVPKLPPSAKPYDRDEGPIDRFAARKPAEASLVGAVGRTAGDEFEEPRTKNSESNAGSLVLIFFGLLASLCLNMWQFWISTETRQRYQVLLEKFRSVSGKGAVELV